MKNLTERPRIEQADCLTFLASLPPQSVDIVTTDPAYSGMNQHLKLGTGRIVGKYQSPENERWFQEFSDEPDNYRNFLSELDRVLKDGSLLYLMFDSFSLLTLGALVREYFDVKNLIVWDKGHIGMGHYYRRRHEHIMFATKGRRKLLRKDLPDIWNIQRLKKPAYPTQKPTKLFEMMLTGSAQPGETVLDPFVGSGSSAIAALKQNCRFIGCDASEKAVNLTQSRIQTFLETGKDPLES